MDSTLTEGPKHRRIFEWVRGRIEQGHYKVGERLPSELQLMERFGVSRTTVIRAMRDLETVNMLERRRGAGTFVKPRAGRKRTADLAFFAPFVAPGRPLPHVESLIHQHVTRLASQSGSRVYLEGLVADGDSPEERFAASVDSVIRDSVEGVFYYSSQLPAELFGLNRWAVERLVGAGLSVVLIDREIEPVPGRSEFSRIGYDNRRGGFLLADHMIRQGCRRIAFVGYAEESLAVHDRLAGFHDAHRAHGRRVPRSLVQMTPEGGIERPLCERLLRNGRPDGIIGINDRTVAVLGRHLTQMGHAIGRDIKLAGFDDDPIATLLPAPLTTIRLPAEPFAEAAYRTMIRTLDSPRACPEQVIIDVELIVRESTTGQG